MLLLGIDDSGRGPVIGPMILAGCLMDEDLNAEFKATGIKDSKQLTAKKREVLAKFICEKAAACHVVQVSPEEIDFKTRAGTNLNKIEAQKAAEIINKLNKGTEPIRVILDCPSPNRKAWEVYLRKFVENPSNLEFVVEHKADINYPSVSAASILAKTTRDAEIEKIKKKIGVNFGSGYPADPITCKFLKEYAGKHKDDGIFRKTWQTWKDLCKTKEQKNLKEFNSKQ
jgi:ribonuclease HII